MTKTTDATNNFEQVDTIEVMHANTYNIENFYADQSLEANVFGMRKDITTSTDQIIMVEENTARAASNTAKTADNTAKTADNTAKTADEVIRLNTKVADLTAEVQILNKTVSLLLGKILDVIETKLN